MGISLPSDFARRLKQNKSHSNTICNSSTAWQNLTHDKFYFLKIDAYMSLTYKYEQHIL